MKKQRKEQLIHCFPEITPRIAERMDGRKSANYVVFLTRGDELYARCFHLYCTGMLVERQRYVFAQDGVVRYGSDDGVSWSIRTEFREPVFQKNNYGYNTDNRYHTVNEQAIFESWMRYCQIQQYKGALTIEYLWLYCRHRNLEYLMKTGYGFLISESSTGYWDSIYRIKTDSCINWKSNNLLKMLNLNRDEFKALSGREEDYVAYIMWRNVFPKYKTAELLEIAQQFGCERGTVDSYMRATGLSAARIVRYLGSHKITRSDYGDYFRQCTVLKLNLIDTAISMPRDFGKAHLRLSKILQLKASEEARAKFEEARAKFKSNYESRRELEYAEGGLILRQPKSMEEIIEEGRCLNHCVGGYAERHARGVLHIMFVRMADKPDVPYYTVEVSTKGLVCQVRGMRNKLPSEEVNAFIEKYKQYLATVLGKEKRRKTA